MNQKFLNQAAVISIAAFNGVFVYPQLRQMHRRYSQMNVKATHFVGQNNISLLIHMFIQFSAFSTLKSMANMPEDQTLSCLERRLPKQSIISWRCLRVNTIDTCATKARPSMKFAPKDGSKVATLQSEMVLDRNLYIRHRDLKQNQITLNSLSHIFWSLVRMMKDKLGRNSSLLYKNCHLLTGPKTPYSVDF